MASEEGRGGEEGREEGLYENYGVSYSVARRRMEDRSGNEAPAGVD